MESLGLICGHLVGDFLLQNDWQACNKNHPLAGKYPHPGNCSSILPDMRTHHEWVEAKKKEYKAHWVCLIHCILYTLAVWACSFWWMPTWGLAVVFLTHYPIDRFKLPEKWMNNVSGQAGFAKHLGPWSVIAVDNTWHILTLFIVGMIHFHM